MTDYFTNPMDVAGEESQLNSMSAQGILLGEQQQCLGELDAKLNQLTRAVSRVLLACPVPLVHASWYIPRPNKFLGKTLCAKAFCFNAPCILLARQASDFQLYTFLHFLS